MDLKRRGNSPDIDIVRETVRREMEGAGELAGYRYIEGWWSSNWWINFLRT